MKKFKTQWIAKTTEHASEFAEKIGVSDIFAKALINRGINTIRSANEMLTLGAHHDPKEMQDLALAAEIMKINVMMKRKFAIVGDYDCDGIFSEQILYELLRILGASVEVFTPNRIKDGYGINMRIINAAKEKGCNVILTCDNGIRAFEEVLKAKEMGFTVIVTDHHELDYDVCEDGEKIYKIPDADAVVNPHRDTCKYPFKGLCGAGVALKLSEYILKDDIPEVFYEYAAFATIADVMELTDENRYIVKRGLSFMRNSDNVGLRALIEENGMSGQEISPNGVGFKLAPTVNAVGRISDVVIANRFLNAPSYESAQEMAKYLIEINNKRKDMTEKAFEKAVQVIEKNGFEDDKVFVIALEDVHEALAGLVAGRLKEVYYKPVIVVTKTEDGLYKGSGRSIDGYHITNALKDNECLLEKFGGHEAAAGLTLKAENIDALRKALNEFCGLLADDFVKKIYADDELDISIPTVELVKEFDLFAPFGNGFEKPLFFCNDVTVTSARVMGKNKNVVKFSLRSSAGPVDAILFTDALSVIEMITKKYGEDAWGDALFGKGDFKISILYTLSNNNYKGDDRLQLVISEVKV